MDSQWKALVTFPPEVCITNLSLALLADYFVQYRESKDLCLRKSHFRRMPSQHLVSRISRVALRIGNIRNLLRMGLEGTTVSTEFFRCGKSNSKRGWTWLQLLKSCALHLPSVQFQDGGRGYLWRSDVRSLQVRCKDIPKKS
jgi:hypothetical protein